MHIDRPIRAIVFGLALAAAIGWALTVGTGQETSDYPNAELLASGQWLAEHLDDEGLVIVDVRTDEHFDGEVVEGAVRMPWNQFQTIDPLARVGGAFVGVVRAQELLGEHGIARDDTVVLYDDVERDGGATASYIFWVLDLLGHEEIKVLDGGIEAARRADVPTSEEPVKPEPVTYQAPPEEMAPNDVIRGPQIRERLGDRYYQVLDVRSEDEYTGEAPNADWQGKALKLGHIPGAYNINYKQNWTNAEEKLLKPYDQLRRMYAGLDPSKAVVTYCHSGRRSSYTYFVLRLMGFSDPRLYDYSWNEWGSKSLYYPVERKANPLQGSAVEAVSMSRIRDRGARPSASGTSGGVSSPASSGGGATSGGGGGGKSGYISCGG